MGIIAVSKTHGSGGTVFGRALAEHLGYEYVNRTYINRTCQVQKEHACAFGLDDEQSPSFMQRFEELMANRSFNKIALMANIYDFALKNNVVFTGMGAHVILGGLSNVISLQVVRRRSERIKAVAELKKISYDDSLEEIQRMDEGQREFMENYFDKPFNDPTLFHLVINSSHVSLENGLHMVSEYSKNYFTPRHSLETENTLKDRLLEKRAEILLFRLGIVHDYVKVIFEANDGVLIVKGVVGGEGEKKRLFDALNYVKEARKIEDHLKVGILSQLIY